MQQTLATLLLTDVVDSTRLVEALGDVAAARLWAAHDQMARDLLPRHRGTEIDKTDGFLLLFDRPVDAVTYVQAYHRLLAQLDPPLEARAGIHRGEVVLRRNPANHVARGAKPIEVEGLAKPIAARVMSAATAGQTLLTKDAHDAARASGTKALPPNLRWVRHGEYLLKGVDAPLTLYEVGHPDHAPLSPPPSSDKVRRADEVRRVHNLGPEQQPILGRDQDLATLIGLVDDARLVTLLGPGGIGKTRLAQALVRSRAGGHAGGAWFVELAEARTLDGVLAALARTLEVPLSQADPVAQLGHAVAGRGPVLLVLDNLEQVMEPGATVIQALLAAAPEVRLVVTSRESFRLHEEQVFPLGPLSVADAGVALFVARAQLVDPRFALTDRNRDDVTRLVTALEGLPLAIELAAARVRVMPPSRMLQRMARKLDVLAPRSRGVSARQATMRSAIAWSWELLEPWEQSALAQASVFEGSFTLEAAAEVLDLSPWPDAPWPEDVVEALLDKSLLRTWNPAESTARAAVDQPYFGMFVTIRDFAAEMLSTDDTLATRDRHTQYYTAFATDLPERVRLPGGDALRLEAHEELDNLMAAQEHAVAQGQWRQAVELTRSAMWQFAGRGPLRRGVRLARDLIAREELTHLQRTTLRVHLLHLQRNISRPTQEEVEATVEAALDTGVPALMVEAVNQRVEGALRGGERDLALSGAAEVLRLLDAHPEVPDVQARARLGLVQARLVGPAAGLEVFDALLANDRLSSANERAYLMANRAVILSLLGRQEDALENYRSAIEILEAYGNHQQLAIQTGNMGTTLQELGMNPEAVAAYRRSLELCRRTGVRYAEAYATVNLGEQLMLEGELEEAIVRLNEGIAIAESCGDRYLMMGARTYLADAQLRAGQLDGAHENLQRNLEMLNNHPIQDMALGTWVLKGRVALARGDRALAEECLEQAEEHASGFGENSAPLRSIERLREEIRAHP